ncbi:uncharacterized protein LOC134444620 [Engraulis encrasicolus]|uniref:uncharacterized protein LOC134444620 n=1 Tax=Engraulis encrasicolus TaxID=184585 RepID=UPI002FCF27D5
MDSQIAKTTQSLTTASEMRETTKMLMQPNANWEEYLTPAPISIAIMGELVFISSDVHSDFSVNVKDAPMRFTYIKYPDSFRACLMQVCNSGWQAFNEAHKNMDQIRIHTASVPDYMKAAVKILFNAPDDVIEKLLPNQLENIRTIADECVTLADGVEKKYSYVINLIQELLEACVNAQHMYGEELENVKRKLQETKLREKTAQELNKRSQQAMEAMSKQVSDAQEQYKTAMNSMPSGWEMIGMDLVEGLTSTFTGLLNGVTAIVTAPAKAAGALSSVLSKSGSAESEGADDITLMNIFSKSGEILKYAQAVKAFVNDGQIDWKHLYDQREKRVKTSFTQIQFERISGDLKNQSECKPRRNALSLCKKAIDICVEFATYTPDKEWDEKKTKDLIKKIEELNNGAMAFDSASKNTLGSPALESTPPNAAKAESGSSGKSASKRASDNARFRIEQSQEQLKHTREAYDKCVENMENNRKVLTEILCELQNCELKEIDFQTKIKMLVKGLDAMGRVKEQWEKMVRFFQMVSNIIKTSLSKTLHNFVTTADDTKKLSYNSKLFAKDLLYNQAFQASNIASLVHMISGTYTEVSNKYLMDRVSSLGKLMAMDKDKPEFLQERLKLQESCREAQEGILQLVLKNKKEFERKTDARMVRIEGELKAILPAASPEETEKIKEIVQAGFSNEEDYY